MNVQGCSWQTIRYSLSVDRTKCLPISLFLLISFPEPSLQKSLAAAAAKCFVSAALEEARLINLARDNQQAQWSRDRYNKAESNRRGVL